MLQPSRMNIIKYKAREQCRKKMPLALELGYGAEDNRLFSGKISYINNPIRLPGHQENDRFKTFSFCANKLKLRYFCKKREYFVLL